MEGGKKVPMLSFLIRRLLQTIPTVLAVVLLVFVLFSVVPGSIVSSMSDDADPQVELRMKKQLGLDDPVYVRFGAYIAKLATGDFGTSFRTREPVTAMIAKRAWPTLQLIFTAMAFSVLLGVPLGFIAALRPGGLVDSTAMVVAVSGLSIAKFWLGLVLMYLFALKLGWLPSFGYGDGGLALAILVGVLAPWLAHTDPVLDANLMNAEEPPSWTWWFGTDDQGRDIYSRVVYGARVSLTVGIVSQLINSVIGVALGLSAGYWGGWWDDVVNALTNVMLAIPSLIFALAIMAVLGPGLTSLLIALGLTNWSFTCRIARASALSLRSQGYVQAATVLGYGDLRIMITQLLPNMLGPIVVIGTLGMGSAVLSEAALSFLGLGVRPPFPSWGSMLSDARDQITTAPWLSVFPGLAIFLTVLGLNLLGDGLRDILDPQSRSRRT